jgi:hypothetical protein
MLTKLSPLRSEIQKEGRSSLVQVHFSWPIIKISQTIGAAKTVKFCTKSRCFLGIVKTTRKRQNKILFEIRRIKDFLQNYSLSQLFTFFSEDCKKH